MTLNVILLKKFLVLCPSILYTTNMNKLYVFTVIRNGKLTELPPVAGSSLSNALSRAMNYNVLLSADKFVHYVDYPNANFR